MFWVVPRHVLARKIDLYKFSKNRVFEDWCIVCSLKAQGPWSGSGPKVTFDKISVAARPAQTGLVVSRQLLYVARRGGPALHVARVSRVSGQVPGWVCGHSAGYLARCLAGYRTGWPDTRPGIQLDGSGQISSWMDAGQISGQISGPPASYLDGYLASWMEIQLDICSNNQFLEAQVGLHAEGLLATQAQPKIGLLRPNLGLMLASCWPST